MTRRRWIVVVNLLAVVVAAVALVVTIEVTGPDVLLDAVRSAGWVLAATFGLGLLAVVARALAMRALLPPSQIALGRILVAQGAATAMQDVTPAGALGDVVKTTLLLPRAPASVVVSAVIAYDVIALAVSAAVLVTGVVLSAAFVTVPSPLDRALWVSAAGLVVVVGVAVWLIRRGLSRWSARLAPLDERLREVGARGGSALRRAFLLNLAARATVWIELYVLVRAIGLDPDAGTTIALVLCQIPVARLSTIVPLGLGLGDLGTAGVFTLFGLPPTAGVAVAMLVRARQLAIAALALIAMAIVQARDRGVPPGGVEPPSQPSEGRAASVRGGATNS